MLKVQKIYIDYLKKVSSEIEKINLEDSSVKSFRLSECIDDVENTELIVPVIGAFSAGKSSLLNSFLGSRTLPEKITPETALATELRYSASERIEAVGGDGEAVIFTIDEMEEIKQRAGEFKYLKMYINNNNVKSIEPLILVDMPGFESPLDLHNQAIMEYINRGVHYVVLTSVEDGSVTKSMKREIENIQEYGRNFSFFLSKTNLKPASEVDEIKESVQEYLEENFNVVDEIGLVDDRGGESLKRILSKIDPEKLFEAVFLERLKNGYFSINGSINTKLTSLSKSKEENNVFLVDLKKALRETTDKKEMLIDQAKRKYSDASVRRIVDAVGRDLGENVDELVSVGISGGETALSSAISEIAKSSLISNLKRDMKEIGDGVIDDFSFGLSGLNSSMSEFTQSDDWVGGITTVTKKLFNSVSGGLNQMSKNRGDGAQGGDVMYKTITTILAVTTTVLTPILELIIVFLPNLLSQFFASSQEKKQRDQMRQTIISQTIPSIKRELGGKLPDIIGAQVNEMIDNIGAQFEGLIKEKQDSIEACQKERDEKNVDFERVIQALKLANDNITTFANNALYKG